MPVSDLSGSDVTLSGSDIALLRDVYAKLCREQNLKSSDETMIDCAGTLVRLYQQGIHDEPTLIELGKSSLQLGRRGG